MFLCNLRCTYVLITFLYSYVTRPYLTQQAFNCSKSTIETLEKGLTYVQSYQWRYQKDVIEVVLVSSLLTLNYFKSFPSFPIVDFEQVKICWENYLTFYSFDICFNVATGGRQDLTRTNAGNSIIFLILHTQWNVTFASLWLLKQFIQGALESLYKCDYQFLVTQKNKAGYRRESITSDHFPF